MKKPFDPHVYPHEKNFRPSHPPKIVFKTKNKLIFLYSFLNCLKFLNFSIIIFIKGYNATINKFPEYVGDPLR